MSEPIRDIPLRSGALMYRLEDGTDRVAMQRAIYDDGHVDLMVLLNPDDTGPGFTEDERTKLYAMRKRVVRADGEPQSGCCRRFEEN